MPDTMSSRQEADDRRSTVSTGHGRSHLAIVVNKEDIDLMILDYVMPDIDAVEVARLGRLKRPRLPILFITGFADTAVLAADLRCARSEHSFIAQFI
jgi:CheY-like chemotaxis protein